MVYQLVLCALRGFALREFVNLAGWGYTLPGRVLVEYGLYSVLCATGEWG